MVHRRQCPAGIEPYDAVTLVGVLHAQPVAEHATLEGCLACEATIEIGDKNLAVSARGELASTLASMRAGSAVEIGGELEVHTWKTGEGKLRERTVVAAKAVRKLAEPAN